MSPLSRENLHSFLGARLGVETGDLADEDALFSSGYLDSFSMVDLIMFLETETGTRMRARDVRMANLDTVAGILAWSRRATNTESP